MTEEQILVLAGAVMLLIGIGMLTTGIYMFYYFTTGKKQKCTAETIGTVVNQVGGGSSLIYPVVEYEANGKVYRKRNSTAITKQKFGSIYLENGYTRGQKLTVHYDPDKPTRWMINESKEQKAISILPMAFGVVFIGVAALFFFVL